MAATNIPVGPSQGHEIPPGALAQPLPAETETVSAGASAMDTEEWQTVSSRKRRNSGDSAGSGRSSQLGPATDRPATATSLPTPTRRLPPLIFDRPIDWDKVMRRLHRAAPANTLTPVCQGGRSVRIETTTIDSFRLAQKLLTDRGIPYYTYALPEERELKVEIIGIPADVPVPTICHALEQLGFTVSSITPLFSPGRHIPRNAFLVKILKVGNFQAIYQLDSLFYLRVKVSA